MSAVVISSWLGPLKRLSFREPLWPA